jgi:uncharacterized protein (TIGR02271 family)
MATNLVGIFDSVNDAERAREWLLRQGLARNTVHVTDNTSLMSRSTSGSSGSGDGEHRGFFSRLFGLGDDDTQSEEYSRELKKGSALLTVIVEDESEARRVEELMAQAGADVIDERQDGQALQGTQRTQAQMQAGETARSADLAQGETLKVMQEELQVGKRDVETGRVRIRQHVTERPAHEQIQLCEEHAIVERVPVDREASPEELDRLSMQDREFEIREHAEQAMVGKTARVIEEVRVGKEVTGHTEQIDDTVRRTDVDVEQLTAAQQASQRQGGTLRDQPRR